MPTQSANITFWEKIRVTKKTNLSLLIVDQTKEVQLFPSFIAWIHWELIFQSDSYIVHFQGRMLSFYG